MITFYLDRQSGTSPYLQLVHQVRQALLLGVLRVGDQLPTVREVVGGIAINPNTVLKAYRELEHEGLIETKPGVGTFIVRTLAGTALSHHEDLRTSLREWLNRARVAGLDDQSIAALFNATMREKVQGGVA